MKFFSAAGKTSVFAAFDTLTKDAFEARFAQPIVSDA
jgi:hypothetical protein